MMKANDPCFLHHVGCMPFGGITCTQGTSLCLPNVKALIDDGLQDDFGSPMEEQALILSAEPKLAAQLLPP